MNSQQKRIELVTRPGKKKKGEIGFYIAQGTIAEVPFSYQWSEEKFLNKVFLKISVGLKWRRDDGEEEADGGKGAAAWSALVPHKKHYILCVSTI